MTFANVTSYFTIIPGSSRIQQLTSSYEVQNQSMKYEIQKVKVYDQCDGPKDLPEKD